VRVAIIGGGLMGAQIGCEYALGGHDVVFHARDLDGVRVRVDAAFSLVSAHRLRTEGEVAKAAQRVSMGADAAAAAGRADLVVESLPEDLELKASVLRPACAVAPDAVVATNTSSLSISAIGEAIGRPLQTVGTHYLNPPLLMRPVEVIAGERTSRETVAFVRTALLDLGKLPIVVQRDVPGFVWNRLQFALVRECTWLVENGVASAEEVDTVVREGLARRWGRVGPLRAIALGGVDTWNRSGRNIVPELSNTSKLPDLSGIAIMDGDLAADAAARDAGLARDLRNDQPRRGSS
jgi:3-hydroxybutyryl-CoA dehydrogenase